MKVTTNVQPMLDALQAAHRAAAEDTVKEIQARQARMTGNLASSYHTVGHDRGDGRLRRIYIVSSAIYADAVERGANTRVKGSVKDRTKARGIYEIVNGKRKRVGYESGPLMRRASRRGPHMKGNHVVADTGPLFLEHMGYRLRGGNYSGRANR